MIIQTVDKKTTKVVFIMLFAAIFSWIANHTSLGLISYRNLVVGFCLFATVCCFPFQFWRKNDFDFLSRNLLLFIALLTMVETCRSVFAPITVHVGNKWISLFGNEHCIYLMLAPCFMLLGTKFENVKLLEKAVWIYMLLSCWSIFVDGLALLPIIWIAGILYPLVGKRYKFLLFLALGESIYAGFFHVGTVRTQIIVIFVCFLSYYLPYVLKNKYLIKAVCYTIIFVPIVYSVIMLIDPSFSIFDVILSILNNATQDTELTGDSRSFLFYEMAEDLSKNNAWFFGKGAYSFYYSNYFDLTSSIEGGDFKYRIISEVTFLQLLMRGGIAYAILYYVLILHAVHKALRYGNNRFVQSIAVMASGWVLVSCFSSEMGTTFIHLCVYLLIGCCLSNTIIRKTDNEILSAIKFKK